MARARARARGDSLDRYETMDLAFHRRLRQGFLEIAAREPERCVVVDAAGSIDDVAGQVFDAVQSRLELPTP
jgi:dTMP kinase